MFSLDDYIWTYATISIINIRQSYSEKYKLVNNLAMSKSKMKWHSIILFVFQFIILLFFLEIFEFNFCKLNENTKKNIEERGLTTMNMRESINSVNNIDIDGYTFNQENVGNSNEMQIINGVDDGAEIN